MRLSTLVLLATAAALPAPASAAVNGALKPIASAQGGCMMNSPGTTGCKAIAAPLDGIGEPSFTKDGLHLIVPGRTSDTVVAFDRDPNTGVLTERTCIKLNTAPGNCAAVAFPPLDGAIGTAISPKDEATLYVVGGNAGPAADGVAWFPLAGGLPQTDKSGCVATAATGGCVAALGLEDSTTAAVSRDERFVYVASLTSDALAVFARGSGGQLDQNAVAGPKCFRGPATALGGCTAEPKLNQPRDIEVPIDDKQVLVASSECVFTDCGSLIAFDRDDFGNLTGRHAGTTGCITAFSTSSTCAFRPGFDPDQIELAPDGRGIYGAGRRQHTLALIDRDPSARALKPRPGACVRQPSPAVADCTIGPSAFGELFDVALAPGGNGAYIANLSGRVELYDRTAAGTVAYKAVLGCIGLSCPAALPQASGVEYVIPSPDGRHVYAMGGGRVWVLAVDHAPQCSNATIDTPFNVTATLTLPCSDPDGDSLTFRITTAPTRGVALLQGDQLSYGPLTGTSGTDTLQFTAAAAGVDADPATVTINVADPPPVITPGPLPAPCTDADRDQFCAGVDCNDASSAIRPGIREVLGNLIDENCDKLIEPYPALPTPVNAGWDYKGSRFTLKSLVLRAPFPAGLTAEMRCTGKRCPFSQRKLTGKVKRGSLNVYKSLGKKTRFRAGQVVEVRVSAPNYNTKVYRTPLKKGKSPIGTTLCLPPGVTTPRVGCS